jgi:hypothetical protein
VFDPDQSADADFVDNDHLAERDGEEDDEDVDADDEEVDGDVTDFSLGKRSRKVSY